MVNTGAVPGTYRPGDASIVRCHYVGGQGNPSSGVRQHSRRRAVVLPILALQVLQPSAVLGSQPEAGPSIELVDRDGSSLAGG